MKIFTSPKRRWQAIALIVGIVGLFTGLYFVLRQYAPFVFNATQLRYWIDGFGPLAPLVFIGVQIVQVIIAPIPGQAAALAAGYLFGTVMGILYSVIGVMIGSAIAFTIARWYGRPVVEVLVHDDLIERFDAVVQRAGLPGLFLLVLVPGLPDDAICFLGGLGHYRLATFVLVMGFGRIPAYIAASYIGDSVATGQLIQGAVVFLGVLVLSVLAYFKRDAIISSIGRN